MRIKEEIDMHLNEKKEESEYQTFEVERKEKKGLVAYIARGIAKTIGRGKLYKVIKKDSGGDRQAIGMVSANSEEGVISKVKKFSK